MLIEPVSWLLPDSLRRDSHPRHPAARIKRAYKRATITALQHA